MSGIDNLGLPKKDISKFTQAAKISVPENHFIFPFSLIDLNLRDDHFKTATRAKIAAFFTVIHALFPNASVEFLMGDTLKSENGGGDVAPLKQSWGELLRLPMNQVDSANTSIKTQYNVQYRFQDAQLIPDTWNIMLSSWDKYQRAPGSDASAVMSEARSKLGQPQLSVDVLCDNNLLFSTQYLEFIKDNFANKFNTLLGYAGDKARIFTQSPLFKEFIQGFALVAAHHVQKTHAIQLEQTNDNSLKKKNILNAVKDPALAIKDFTQSLCYTLQELMVIFDILTRQAHNGARVWMLYPSGVTDVPDFHPIKKLNEIFCMANLPRFFYTGAAYRIPNNVSHNDNDQPSSNGGNSTMLKRVISEPIIAGGKPQPEQQPNNSVVASMNSSGNAAVTKLSNGSGNQSDDETTSPPDTNSSNSSLNSGDGRQPSSPGNGGLFEMEAQETQTQQADMLKRRLDLLADGASDYLAENPDDFSNAMSLFKRTSAKIQQKVGTATATSAPTAGYARANHAAAHRSDLQSAAAGIKHQSSTPSRKAPSPK
jgi:hypothetical protein